MSAVRHRVRCVIVDEHALLVDLLAAAVGGVPGLEVTGTAIGAADAARLVAQPRVHLLIIGWHVGTTAGVEIARRLVADHRAMKCIVLAAAEEFVCPPDLLDVISFVDKSHTLEALRTEIARVVDVPAGGANPGPPAGEIRDRLTDREWQLFVALGDGLSNKELGARLQISTRTVETHRKAIARKLGFSGAALVRAAVLQRRAGGDAAERPGVGSMPRVPDAAG